MGESRRKTDLSESYQTDCIGQDFQLSDHLIIDSDGRLIIQCNHGHTHSSPQRYTMEYHSEVLSDRIDD